MTYFRVGPFEPITARYCRWCGSPIEPEQLVIWAACIGCLSERIKQTESMLAVIERHDRRAKPERRVMKVHLCDEGRLFLWFGFTGFDQVFLLAAQEEDDFCHREAWNYEDWEQWFYDPDLIGYRVDEIYLDWAGCLDSGLL